MEGYAEWYYGEEEGAIGRCSGSSSVTKSRITRCNVTHS